MHTWLRDVRYGLRTLARHKSFTAAAVLTLALGVGANSAIFAIVAGVLLRPLPYPDPERLYAIWHTALEGDDGDAAVSPGNFDDWRLGSRAFTALAAYRWSSLNLTGGGEPLRLLGVRSMGSIFDVLESAPLLGRTFTADDDAPGAPRVAVLAHGLWQRVFGGDPDIVGRSIVLDGQPTIVVGVMPHGFHFPDPDAEFWIPSGFDDELRRSRTEYFLQVIGRLQPSASPSAAGAELEAVMARARLAHPQPNANVTIAMRPYRDDLTRGVRTRLVVLMGAVALVLLIACVNVGNLLLVRATRRRREMAVRRALGAGRWRIVQQLTAESLALGVLGGAAGLALGALLIDVLPLVLPVDLPRLHEVRLDWRVVLFALGTSVAGSFVFGLAPALQLSAGGPAEALRDGHATTARHRLRSVLVVSELALALVLLTGGGLLLKSFLRLQQVDPGFETAQLLTFRLSLPESRYPDAASRLQFFERAVTRVRMIPGVQAAALVDRIPLAGGGNAAWFSVVGSPAPAAQTPPVVRYQVIDPAYFKTMGIRLLQGRLLTAADRDASPGAVVNRSMARRFWPDGDPLGSLVRLGPPDGPFPQARVVGIVEDVKVEGLHAETPAIVYLPHAALPLPNSFDFVVRTAPGVAGVAAAAPREIQALDPTLPVYGVRWMDDVLTSSVVPMRSTMLLVALFASLALVLAAVGVFGVLSFTVGQRAREIGIRMALGADPRALRWLVLRQAVRQTLAGVTLGVLGSLAVTRVARTILFDVSPTDAVALAAAAVSVAAVAALAAYLPARRATSVDPTVVLRPE